jgi:heptosyltransferase-2
MTWRTDCRHFEGDRPCRISRQCRGCPGYQAWKGRCLIIKLAARGDVLRTTPLGLALKQTEPNLQLTWLTDPDAAPLLEHNGSIDRLLCYGPDSLAQLSAESFDRIICLDKEPRAAGLASILEADRKSGFGWDPLGCLIPLDRNSRHIYDLGLSDRLKFKVNQKSYQQLVIEAAGLEYRRQPYQYRLTGEETEWAGRYLKKLLGKKAGLPLIGLNTGVGRAFPTKAWPERHFISLAREIRRRKMGLALVLGGPDEKSLVAEIARAAPGAFAVSCGLTLRQFGALVSRLDLLVSADSLAMHLGIALERKVVALFGPTCSQEIDLYGRGEKLSAGADCAPCYRRECPETKCLSGLEPERVLGSVARCL